MIALAVCTAVITTMGGFSVAAEEVYEVAADEETVTDVPAELRQKTSSRRLTRMKNNCFSRSRRRMKRPMFCLAMELL